ncbi:PREDICTED: RNA-binding protein 34-like, partial [Ceratosolen solmsi marchali]|uniref:RNA-binding protein 34-like n=1 Tax=Ceratosolen solmsi marchali TaxID=326594 RepID=A0AAJ6YN79_9HYME
NKKLENDKKFFKDTDDIIEDNLKNKGVKMFKGLKIIKKNSYNKNINDSEIDVSKFSDDDVNDSIGLEALLKDDITDDDEDFNENELSDDDEDISDEDDAINYNDLKFGINDNEIDSVYDKNDELTTSLNKSLIADNGDDNISNERNDGTKYQIIEEEKLCKKPLVNIQEINSNLLSKKQAKLDARTVFVGNIPIDTSIKTIEQLFKPFGEIENLRIRGVVPNDVRTSFKIATITKKKCPKLKSMYIFIVFKEEASAKLALKLNGHKLGNNTLRVDFSNSKNKYRDEKKSVFIGNLPFDITEDEVRAHFTSCGNIESVRIVRDRKSGISRGIGYVNFIEEDSVSLALELHDTLLKNCKLRVKTYCFKSKEIKRKHKNI